MKARRVALAALVTVAAVAGLTACDDPHKGEHCVASVTILVPISHPGSKYAAGFVTYVPMTQCSQWAPDNPATVKP